MNAVACRFDHSLDNYVGKKEDLRFTNLEQAEDFAITQYMSYYETHIVLERTDGLFMVIPTVGNLAQIHDLTMNQGAKEVSRINSMPMEG